MEIRNSPGRSSQGRGCSAPVKHEPARSKAMAGARQKYDHEILLLQGGGALGAYHAGLCVRRASTSRDRLNPDVRAPGLRVFDLTD